MNILLDVDDTLTDFLEVRNKLIEKYLKSKGLPFRVIDFNCTKSAKVADWPVEECVNFWREVGTEAQLNCSPQKDCAKVVKKLREQGHKIFIVTARPDLYFEAFKYTKEWLDRNGIPYDCIITGKLDKKQTMIDNEIDVVIDDSISTIKFADELGLKSFLFSTVENSDAEIPKNCKRVYSWSEIDKLFFEQTATR